jgi:cytochrome c oxidase cbb3-type subunit 4
MIAYSILGIATTVLAFVAFVGIVAWAYGSGRRKAFEEAANAPFALPDEADENSGNNSKRTGPQS